MFFWGLEVQIIISILTVSPSGIFWNYFGCLTIYLISFSSFGSKTVKLSGVVTEDKRTGDRYITHVTIMEDTVGAKKPEPDQTDSQSTAQGKEYYHNIKKGHILKPNSQNGCSRGQNIMTFSAYRG